MPDIADYDEAMLSAKYCLQPTHLRTGKVFKEKVGPKNQPHLQKTIVWAKSGTYAVVYRLDMPAPDPPKAIRCFLSQVGEETRERYNAFSRWLPQHAAPFTVGFKFHEKGIKAKGCIQPVLEMDFVDGRTLLEEVEELCRAKNQAKLRNLCEKWRELTAEMDRLQMAHGDLAGQDVMVTSNGRLVLIDYDGIYFPDPVLQKYPSRELGSYAFHHKHASKHRDYNERMDDFSALANYVALLAYCAAPELFARFGSPCDGKLLYEARDLEDPRHSEVFHKLRSLPGAELQHFLPILEQACVGPLDQVPRFTALFGPATAVVSSSPQTLAEANSLTERKSLMSYSQPWSTDNPGCCIFLLDQSGSMMDPFGGNSSAHGQLLKDAVANILNSTISRIGKESRKGTEIRPRVELAVIGYGAGVGSALSSRDFGGKDLISIAELFTNPLRVEKRKKKIYHAETGEEEERDVEFRVWVEPAAGQRDTHV
jgi:hypothetical protein